MQQGEVVHNTIAKYLGSILSDIDSIFPEIWYFSWKHLFVHI